MILTSGLSYRSCWIIQNSQKMPFWMIQIAKNEVFDHFLEFGASDRLQIAYFDSTKWSWQVDCHILHAGSFKHHKKCLFEWSKEQKMRFLVIFLSFVHRIGLKLRISIEMNGLQALACVSLMLDHSKTIKMPFWSLDEKWGWLFLEFGLLDWFGIA